MTPDFQREEALFNAASELESAAARAAYLARECAGDDRLRKRIEEMLEFDAPAAEFFRAPQPGLQAHESVPQPTLPGPNTTGVGYGKETIGSYRLLEKLGEGGFGTVYVAEQTQPVRRRVALKVIKAGMDTREVIARFNTERQALALMDHPNIARVLDAGSTNADRPYFVMELVLGIRITEYCDQERLGIPQRLALFISVCRAVQHAHQKGVIHRDLKPSNILVVVQDGVPVPKVIDFGIAKATERGLTEGTVHTQLHQLIGTPAYMSPEQAELTGLNVDTRSDIYSLGVLLYELLTGFTPFQNEELIASGWDGMRRMIREKDPAPPSTRLSQSLRTAESKTGNPISNSSASSRGLPVKEQIAQLKGDLDWIVMKCLEKDRNRRYETANGLAMDLQRHLQNEPVIAGPPGKAYLVQKFITRHRWPVIAIATIAILILAGLIGTSLGMSRAKAARIQADQNAARASDLAAAARTSEAAARLAEMTARAAQATALRQAYSASMLSASDALERGQIDTVRHYLDIAPVALRGWEWRHLSSRLDLSIRVHNYPRPNTQLHVLPDGRSYYDVSALPIGGIRRWDMDTGQLLATLPTRRAYHGSWLVAGGKQLIAQTADDSPRALEVWDLERGLLLSSHPAPPVFDAAPDGSRVAGMEEHKLHITHTRSGLTRVSAAVPFANTLCFQPDGRRLAVSPSFGKVALVDTESLQVLHTFEAHRNDVVAYAFTADGRWLATGSMDNTIRITDVAANPPAPVTTLRGQSGWIGSLRFSPDGSLLVSTSQDRTLHLWDTRTGESRAVLQVEGADPGFLPDGRTLIVGDAKGVRFSDISSLDAWGLRGHLGNVYPVLLSPDGATIYSGGWDGYVGHSGSLRFWDAATGDEIAATGAADEYVRAAALSADGSRLAISVTLQNGSFSRIDIVDTATGTTVASGAGTRVSKIDTLAFDPTAERLICLDPPHGVAHVVDARTGLVQQSPRLLGSRGFFTSCVAWSPDGATVALCGWTETTIDLFNAQSMELVRQWPHGHRGLLHSIAFSPDSQRILTTSDDGIARVWDAVNGTLLHDLVGHAGRVLCAVYSPDGKRIATGGNDRDVRLWDSETFDPVARLGGHQDYVFSLAWRADSQQLISGSGDNTVRIWDTQPLIERVQARRERQTLLGQVEPMVQRLFTELGDAHKVIERVKADPSLGARAQQIALQVALRTSLARRHTGQP